MIEHERSFVFTHKGGNEFKDRFDIDSEHKIEDHYLNKGLRVRVKDESRFILTQKTGDKSKGYRFEEEREISKEAAVLLIPQASLSVIKTRFELISKDDRYIVTMDIVDNPMKLAILEVEAVSEIGYPIPGNISEKLFDEQLKECPLCAHSLFKRKIGICGGPSSGKSETAKILSHKLNTLFSANSFHVVEFATSFIQKYHRSPTFIDQFFVWFGQHEREVNASNAHVIISDCPTFLAYVYMLEMQKPEFCVESALYLSKIYKRVLFDLFSYTDMIFMPIVRYKENNVRYQSKDEALEIERRVKQFLTDHNIGYHTMKYDYDILPDLFYIN